MTTETSAPTGFDAAALERIGSGAAALSTGAVLALAAWLEPAGIGYGTHQQIGLGPCTFLAWTGHPCPMCGATTTFALMAEFHPLQAAWNQPFAAVLFLLVLGTFGVSATEFVVPARRWTRIFTRIEPVEHWLAGAFLLLMGLSWAWKDYLMAAG